MLCYVMLLELDLMERRHDAQLQTALLAHRDECEAIKEEALGLEQQLRAEIMAQKMNVNTLKQQCAQQSAIIEQKNALLFDMNNRGEFASLISLTSI